MSEGRPTRDRASIQLEANQIAKRTLGSPALFALAYTSLASGLYYSLGAVTDHALGLTPFVFAATAVFFVLCVMTYVEGASLHQERAGATVFARYAFNELVSFVAGWAILLDFLILIALTAFTATSYLQPFWKELGDNGAVELVLTIAIIVAVAVVNVVGLTARRLRRLVSLTVVDVLVQVVVIALGFALVFDVDALTHPIGSDVTPKAGDVIFALAIAAAAAAAGLDASSGLAGEVRISRRGLKRLVGARMMTVLVLYCGIALVALSALPVTGSESPLGGPAMDAPLVGVVGAYDHGWVSDALRYVVGTSGFLILVAGTNSAMLGLSRLAYSLATNRQIPSAVGRLHPTRGTPFVVIVIAAVLAIGLVIPQDLDFLIGIYAFGAMLTFTIAHVSVCVLRYREPDRDRPYAVPLSVKLGRSSLPLPAVLGGLTSGAGFISVIALHGGARIAGLVWLAFGLTLYVIYRKSEGKPLLKRVTVPASALTKDATEAEYGSILVPLLGTPLDDDIVQTAGRLARAEHDDDEGDTGATIEALWVIPVPLSLPLDAALPDATLQEGRRALARAKAVGEEYAGVQVATATVRARRVGQAIVEEARRRGVEVIVMGAEEPSRIRGGGLFGGVGGPLDNFVGDVTRYVVDKAPCRVILTAPPAGDDGTEAGDETA